MIRLAICDDDAQAVDAHRALAERALARGGYTVTMEVYTKSESLLADICEDGRVYDLILLDIEMPGLDGMALARRIAPLLPQVRVIFITSHREYAIDAYALNIFRYVPKDELENACLRPFSMLRSSLRWRTAKATRSRLPTAWKSCRCARSFTSRARGRMSASSQRRARILSARASARWQKAGRSCVCVYRPRHDRQFCACDGGEGGLRSAR